MQIASEEIFHPVAGIDPAADPFDGTVYTDVIDVKNHTSAVFIIQKGVGVTGTSTVTVQACDDIVPSNRSAIAFRYKRYAADVAGALTAVAAAGFDTTAGSSEMYVIEVDAAALAAAGYHYVQLKFVEVVNSPVLASVLCLLMGPRYASKAQESAID